MRKRRNPLFPAEVREHAFGMVLVSQGDYPTLGAAITSIAGKIGGIGETLRSWVKQLTVILAFDKLGKLAH